MRRAIACAWNGFSVMWRITRHGTTFVQCTVDARFATLKMWLQTPQYIIQKSNANDAIILKWIKKRNACIWLKISNVFFYLKVLVIRFVFHCTSKFSYLSSNLSLVNDLTVLFLVVTHPLHIASQIFLLHPLRSNRDQSTVYRWRGIGWLDSMRSAGWCRITWMGIWWAPTNHSWYFKVGVSNKRPER